MANLWGYTSGVPKISLIQEGSVSAFTTITLPRPSVRELKYHKVGVKKTYLDKRQRTYFVGYRPTLELQFQELDSDSEITDIMKVANWPDKLLIQPFSDISWLKIEMEIPENGVDIEPIGGKTTHHAITLYFEGTRLVSRIPNADSMFLAAFRYSIYTAP